MSDTPQLLLAHHLKALKLPTFLREYDKLARQCAAEGLDQLVDHGGRGGEADRQALLAGRQPQSESNVTLAGAAVADRDHVLSASNVLAAG